MEKSLTVSRENKLRVCLSSTWGEVTCVGVVRDAARGRSLHDSRTTLLIDFHTLGIPIFGARG